MDDGPISFWSKVVESSPVIVLLLLTGYAFFGRGAYLVINALLTRLDKKDEQVIQMQREMLEALEQVRKAVDNLSEALRHADRRH